MHNLKTIALIARQEHGRITSEQQLTRNLRKHFGRTQNISPAEVQTFFQKIRLNRFKLAPERRAQIVKLLEQNQNGAAISHKEIASQVGTKEAPISVDFIRDVNNQSKN